MGVRLKLDRVSQFCYTGVPQAQVEPRATKFFRGFRMASKKKQVRLTKAELIDRMKQIQEKK